MRPRAIAMILALTVLPPQAAWAQGFGESWLGNGRPKVSPYRAQGSPFGPPMRSPFAPYAPSYGYDDMGSYRTLCVRLCDGFYFPISYRTTRGGLARDADVCAASCGDEGRLFYHPNPGGDVDTMVDMTGRAYADLPTAFTYRKRLVNGCQCRPQPWSEAERQRHRAYADGTADREIGGVPDDISAQARTARAELAAPDPRERAVERPEPIAREVGAARDWLPAGEARGPLGPRWEWRDLPYGR
jgi:hypothetical protein